jgi:hypothetical protein
VTEEQRVRLDQIKADVQNAAQAMQSGDSPDAIEHLIDAFLTLTTFLETVE